MIVDHEDVSSADDGPPGNRRIEAKGVIDRIAQDPQWEEPATPITLASGLLWRPHLASKDGAKVLHVHLTAELRSFVSRRMMAAAEAGLQVHFATDLAALYREDVLKALVAADAFVHLVDDREPGGASHVLAAVCDCGVHVAIALRADLSRMAWERRKCGGPWTRGKRFEALLAFLLSQVIDFRVIERNYRTETEELDAVLQIGSYAGRCWAESGVPFILVEAKNWDNPVPQKEVTAFAGKILTKRGRARIGLMFGAAGFTSDAMGQETKLGQREQIVVALIGPEDFEKWLASTQPDDFLESLVRHAMLR